MAPVRCLRKAVASACLAGAMLVCAPGTNRVEAGADHESPAGFGGRSSMSVAQALRARRTVEQRLVQMQRAAVHARMPSTMYASTPDPAPPPHVSAFGSPSPHPVVRAPATPPAAASSAVSPAIAHHIALFPAAARWSQGGYRGFVRIINRSEDMGEVRIEAVDDEGVAHGPVTVALGASESVHFVSADLEQGNAEKSLEGVTGPGEGDWRLVLTSALDIEVLAYIETDDGLLASMHDLVARTAVGHRVPFFNPGSNPNQISRLRVVNPGTQLAEVRIEGIDDHGVPSPDAVEFSVPTGASRTVSAQKLETGEGVRGALGVGTGKWRLVVTADQPIEIVNLLSSPTGHLTNLSTAPAHAMLEEGGAAVVHEVPLLPSAARRIEEGVLGFVRVINHSGEAGEVHIEAFDDDGTASSTITLKISASEALHFNSDDLEQGNADKGLSSGVGEGTGDWRLRVRSSLELDVLAYIQTDDGFLASVHDLVPHTKVGHRVGIFNPGSNSNQVSRLRLINSGSESASVRIEGIDERGASPGGAVRLEVPARGARTVTSAQLESGEGVDGALGDGEGQWRLVVTADQPIKAMNLLSSPTGHLANLSTTAGARTATEVFGEHISGPVVQAKCVNCHVQGGIAGATRLQFVRSSTPNHATRNLNVFDNLLATIDDGAALVLNKIQGVGHGGGVQVAAGTDEFAHMEWLIGLLGEDVSPAPITPQTLFDNVQMATARKTIRRAALIFAGRTPTEDEYAAIGGGSEALRLAIHNLMTGPEFHEFLIRGANDRLLTERAGHVIDANLGGYVDFINETFRRKSEAYYQGGTERDLRQFYEWDNTVQYGFRRAPLALIAHVVENDLPYTEVLTADYIMANPWAAKAYGARTDNFDDPDDMHEFKPSKIVKYYRQGEGVEREFDRVIGAERIINPGPLITVYPHAGILNTTAFLYRYPTTATNRNRARSRWTYYHFLGLDIEKSASRTTDPVALADTNNPTLRNPACTVCHRVLDPVAGTFQNYSDDGYYRYSWGGMDSLDDLYKQAGEPPLELDAVSWEGRRTLTWPVVLAAGSQTLRVLYTNHFYDESTDVGGGIFLDRLRVTDARGGVILSHELEDIEPPVAHWGRCGNKNYNPSTEREDHLTLWGGYLECALHFDVEVPSDGLYHVEVVGWSRGPYEQYGDNGFAKLSIAVNPYEEGDTWYRDMRVPGFAGELGPNPDNSLQWLAKQIVADKRFAEAAVKFWWPTIMGSEVAEPPEDEGDADFEGHLLTTNAQGAEVARLAQGFRLGFRGRMAYNLKDLLVEIVLSDWFRTDAIENLERIRRVALRDAGARRLLTPEELDRKTAAITGLQWGREPRINDAYRGQRTKLTDDYRLLYGGIDSDGVGERARDITSVMAGVAKRHAAQVSCPVVMREFFLVPEADRRLFAGIDRFVTPGLEFGTFFDIVARASVEKETLSFDGELTAGPKTVRLSFTNDYWAGDFANRNIHLDRLDVRSAAGEVVASVELEGLPERNCASPNGDNFALWCEASVEVPIEIPSPGRYLIEVVAWADQAGSALPRLRATVEDSDGSGAGADAIRSKLVELHDKLLGLQVTPHSTDVENSFRIFLNAMERRRGENDTQFDWWQCDTEFDFSYFDGILDDAVAEFEDESGWRWHGLDWDRVNDYMDGTDWSDPYHAAQAWVMVLAYLLMDYRYLYL